MDARLVSLVAPGSAAADRYRMLGHVLREDFPEISVVAVTSAVRGEGKSTTAINLAAALAMEADARILLVEADLRAPSVGRLLGRGSADPGLAQIALDQSTGLDDVLIGCPSSRLAILLAGSVSGPAYEILDAPRLDEVMAEARLRYDTIVVDTPPLLPVPDSEVLARWVDGFLVVVGAHRTPRLLFEEGLRCLEHRRVLGTVLNGADRPSSSRFACPATEIGSPRSIGIRSSPRAPTDDPSASRSWGAGPS